MIEISTDSALWKAMMIEESAKRLVNFHKLSAPQFIIEHERQLLLKKIVEFPVDSENQLLVQKQKQEMRKEELQHLTETGFFKEQS